MNYSLVLKSQIWTNLHRLELLMEISNFNFIFINVYYFLILLACHGLLSHYNFHFARLLFALMICSTVKI
jgi:hypothetical protein